MPSRHDETRYFTLGLDHLPPAERLDYWNAVAGARMICKKADGGGQIVRAAVQGLIHGEIELLDYRADGFTMDRTARMCRVDGRDEICLGLVAGPVTAAEQNGEQMSVGAGALYVVDFARPVRSLIPTHHEIALVLPRAVVAQAIGGAPDRLGGLALRETPVGRLLASHLTATAAEAARLSPRERGAALLAARELALAALAAAAGRTTDADAFAHGFYEAAKAMISRRCGEHDLTPEKLQRLMGCSRSSLYRAFAARGEGVAEAIREARLQRAWSLLTDPAMTALTVAEAAYRSGFPDPSGFSRMFRRRFGISPREAAAFTQDGNG